MDVEELLAAGIDVYTTLNIQHVESLNDVVARITSIRVRETVPDSIIDRADDIELIDLTPEDLIHACNEGKVYVPEQAERATRNYFSPGNLTALRELALRRTAQRVDAQMVDYMRAHAIEGSWSASERVLVLVDRAPGANAIVRHARRMADRLRAQWTAIHVETPADASRAKRSAIRSPNLFASRKGSGGEAVIDSRRGCGRPWPTMPQANNFTHIIAAKSEPPALAGFLQGVSAEKLIRPAGDANVHIVARGERSPGPKVYREHTIKAKTDRDQGLSCEPWLCGGCGAHCYPAAAGAWGLKPCTSVPDRGPDKRRDLWPLGLAVCLSYQRSFL